MNGVCSRRLLDNIDAIFAKIHTLMLETLSKRRNVSKEQTDVLTLVLEDFISLFKVMDVVFVNLCILDPTPDEIERT